jgi:hypothetical protein
VQRLMPIGGVICDIATNVAPIAPIRNSPIIPSAFLFFGPSLTDHIRSPHFTMRVAV